MDNVGLLVIFFVLALAIVWGSVIIVNVFLLSDTRIDKIGVSIKQEEDDMAWWKWVLLIIGIIVRILIGIFKLLVQVARGMGKN